MSLLEMHGVTKNYLRGTQPVPALRGVDLNIEKGEFLAIVGPSGSGKSTLLNILGCLDTPSAGSVRYAGTELSTLSEEALSDYRKLNIAFIFQSYNLIPVLTVQENVELPLVIERTHSKQEVARRALEAIAAVGLQNFADRTPAQLSGGQEQRVAIARALVKNPLVVLADEPTANLDSATAEDVISVMETLNRERQTTFIFSTHDARVEAHARRIITLRDGLISSDLHKPTVG
ncbi:MAG: ABC transporter ATP-binding protein [Myxococcota bacterium]